MTFAILEESELPNTPAGRGRDRGYPWHELKLGQGFVIPKGAHTCNSSAYNLAYYASKRNGKTFTAQKQTNGDFVIKRTA